MQLFSWKMLLVSCYVVSLNHGSDYVSIILHLNISITCISFSIFSVSNPLMSEQQLQKDFSNDPVFYGPDGNVLTEEESAFLWNVTSCPTEAYYDDDDEYVFY